MKPRPRVPRLVPLAVLLLGAVTLAAGPSESLGGCVDCLERVTEKLTVDLRSDVAAAIGKGELPTRSTLARGLTITWSGERPVEVILVFSVIEGRTISPFNSKSFTVKFGTNPLPSEEVIPRSINTTFSPGDQFLRSETYVRGDQLEQETKAIASTGFVYGRVEVDWGRQQVLHIGVVPSTGVRAYKYGSNPDDVLLDEVALRTIAFVRNGR